MGKEMRQQKQTLKAGKQMGFDFKRLRKGNPMLTVGKQKNNSIFSAGPRKSSETGNTKYWKYR